MKKQYIHNGWILKEASLSEPLCATVPGCLHTDLINAGLIRDIFYRDNAEKYDYVEHLSPIYETHFDSERTEGVVLKFDGIDTFCDIYLNGVLLGSVHNMFIPHAFDVSGKIKLKDNVLRLEFTPPVKALEGKKEREGAFTHERINARRIQCTFGWDWVYRFVTMGIYRPVYLEYREGLEIEDLCVHTDYIDSYGAQLTAEISFSGLDYPGIASLDIFSPYGELVFSDRFYVDKEFALRKIDVSDPELWYPNGYGAQPLYTAVVRTNASQSSVKFGIRTLRIQMLRDKKGSEYYNKAKQASETEIGKIYSEDDNFFGFSIIVNGVKIFAKGANFVPCEPFPSEESDEKLRMLVREAKEMGVNILRVWGGGLFEKEAFYDECDRCGLMIAHDFLMACGTYPEDEEWFIKELLLESEYAVKMLRRHTSLAWFHGDNENASMGSDLLSEYTGRRSAYDGIYPNVLKYAPKVPFLVSSPWGGNRFGSITSGTTHNTNYLVQIFEHLEKGDFSDYKEFLAQLTSRFMSEEPTFGAVCRDSMLKIMTEEDLLDPDSVISIFHTRTNPGLEGHLHDHCTNMAEKVLGKFADPADRYFKQKYIQCEWARIMMELALRNIGYNNGIIYWMYNDCWPASLGWAFVDYYTARKAAFYTFRRASASVVGSFSEDGRSFVVTNTSNESVTADVIIKSVDVSKPADAPESLIEKCVLLDPYSSLKMDVAGLLKEGNILVSDTVSDSNSYRSFYKHGNLHIVKEDAFRVVNMDEESVTICANKYIQVLELEGEYVFSDNYFTMLQGEIKTVQYKKRNESAKSFNIASYVIK